MLFREHCERFLNQVANERHNAVENAKVVALREEYEPFAKELVATKEALVAQELKTKQELIARIERDYTQKVQLINSETEQKLASKKAEVAQNAEATAKAEYDKFIEGFIALAEKTKI